jgi:hypothetical protein
MGLFDVFKSYLDEPSCVAVWKPVIPDKIRQIPKTQVGFPVKFRRSPLLEVIKHAGCVGY